MTSTRAKNWINLWVSFYKPMEGGGGTANWRKPINLTFNFCYGRVKRQRWNFWLSVRKYEKYSQLEVWKRRTSLKCARICSLESLSCLEVNGIKAYRSNRSCGGLLLPGKATSLGFDLRPRLASSYPHWFSFFLNFVARFHRSRRSSFYLLFVNRWTSQGQLSLFLPQCLCSSSSSWCLPLLLFSFDSENDAIFNMYTQGRNNCLVQ